MLCFLLFSVNKRVVYFTAGTVEVIDKYWKEDIIIFPQVISNVGEAYNASNGVFTAPHCGVYVFTFFLALTNRREIKGILVVNGSPKVGTYVKQRLSSAYTSAGNCAVFPLVQGETVWVKHTSGTSLWTQPDAPISTFSGFSLQ